MSRLKSATIRHAASLFFALDVQCTRKKPMDKEVGNKVVKKDCIRTMLVDSGVDVVVTTRGLAEALGLSVRTITGAKNKGELKQLDRNCYELDSVVEWLYANPRYITGIRRKQA